MIIKETITISCYRTPRTLHIYLPDDYTVKRQSYPVMYMFDGHNLFFDEDATFHKSWGLKTFLDTHSIPIIIVGIECNHIGNKRLEEFSPYSFYDESVGQINATGKQLLDWIVTELKPYIDRKYRTKTGRKSTAIGGSSMGGLMALYGCIKYNHIFSKAACLSCYLDQVFHELYQEDKSSVFHNTKIYLSWGSDEVSSKQELATLSAQNLAICQQLLERQVYIYPNIIVNGEHSEYCWEKEIPTFMNFLFPYR